MPVNDPHVPSGDRRTFDPKAMSTPQGSENFHTWMDSAHSRMSPGASHAYSYGGGDQIDYYSGIGPEVAAASAELRYGKGPVQSPKTSDGKQAHRY